MPIPAFYGKTKSLKEGRRPTPFRQSIISWHLMSFVHGIYFEKNIFILEKHIIAMDP